MTRPKVTADTMIWNVEPAGQFNPWFRSKFHVDRGDSSALCSSAVLLNCLDLTRPVGFGGAIYADQGERLGDTPREDVCRKCVPVMP